jgi:hypothetical protein
LEDLFNPARLQADWKPKPVKGHAFGMNISQQDQQALLAYLQTL